MGSILVLDHWAPSCQGNSQVSLLPNTAIQRAIAVVPPTSLVVPRLGTTNDGGGTTSPAEAKIIVGGPCTHRGWGGNVNSINTDVCFDICVSQGSRQQSDGQQPASSWKGH